MKRIAFLGTIGAALLGALLGAADPAAAASWHAVHAECRGRHDGQRRHRARRGPTAPPPCAAAR